MSTGLLVVFVHFEVATEIFPREQIQINALKIVNSLALDASVLLLMQDTMYEQQFWAVSAKLKKYFEESADLS